MGMAICRIGGPGYWKKFDYMTDCEVKEYGNFTAVGDVKPHGKLRRLAKNTADNGGVRLALMSVPRRRQTQKNIDLDAKRRRL